MTATLSRNAARPVTTTGLDNLLAALRSGPASAGGGAGDLVEIAARLESGDACGLVFNPASISSSLTDACTSLLNAGVRVRALFGPEHGVRGAAAAGDTVPSSTDPITGLPVHSLYGPTKRPTAQMLDGLDLVLFDLQDAGVRFWTYTWTLSYVVEACTASGIPVVVLDRPNPLGGTVVEGPLLQEGLESFVGRYPVPTRHGLTMGEMGRLFAARFTPGARVLVAPVVGWRREDGWEDTGLDWAAPSPNIPTADTAWIYPATCFLEGTNVSEGRGTPMPFRTFGAPWVDPRRLSDRLNQTTGSRWRPLYFTPTASKHRGVACGGVQWYPPSDPAWRQRFQPVTLGMQILHALKDLWPDEFAWLVATTGRSHFDLLVGSSDIRPRLDQGEPVDTLTSGWAEEAAEFRRTCASLLIY